MRRVRRRPECGRGEALHAPLEARAGRRSLQALRHADDRQGRHPAVLTIAGARGAENGVGWPDQPVVHSFGTRTISMRRFLARPSGVTLSATGLNSPKAAAERLADAIPWFWRERATLIA